MKQNRLIAALLALSAVLLSIPFLVPGTGAVALVAFVPMLCAERMATLSGKKHFFWWYYAAFVVFNALTTWWVSKATVGGGIFAVLANALFMSIIFAIFRLSRKRFSGILPYIFLMTLWIAWERFYMVGASVSWPWLTLGNAFGRSVSLVQWYEYTGLLGGSLWVWACNIGIFSLMVALSDGRWWGWNKKAHAAAISALVLVILGPIVWSEVRYATYKERDDAGKLDVVLAQSNFDPWHKLHYTPQSEQNAQVVGLFEKQLEGRKEAPQYPDSVMLMLVPESFSSDIWMNEPQAAPTFRTFSGLVQEFPNVNLIFGASTHRAFYSASKPDPLAYQLRDGGWYLGYNTAFVLDRTGRADYRNKVKLVVGSEKTPFPKLIVPLDDKLGHVMGRCVADKHASNFEVREYAEGTDSVTRRIQVGVPICYESIYSEFCGQYVNRGAQLFAVITNDGWWGNTPGYRQHFSFSRLRAIEYRRDVARCANTGISGFINQRGEVVSQSGWWVPDVMQGKVKLSDRKTFYATYGDFIGRVCTFVGILLLLLLVVRLITRRK